MNNQGQTQNSKLQGNISENLSQNVETVTDIDQDIDPMKNQTAEISLTERPSQIKPYHDNGARSISFPSQECVTSILEAQPKMQKVKEATLFQQAMQRSNKQSQKELLIDNPQQPIEGVITQRQDNEQIPQSKTRQTSINQGKSKKKKSLQNTKQSNLKLFRDQIQFIQNTQVNLSRVSSSSSALVYSMSANSINHIKNYPQDKTTQQIINHSAKNSNVYGINKIENKAYQIEKQKTMMNINQTPSMFSRALKDKQPIKASQILPPLQKKQSNSAAAKQQQTSLNASNHRIIQQLDQTPKFQTVKKTNTMFSPLDNNLLLHSFKENENNQTSRKNSISSIVQSSENSPIKGFQLEEGQSSSPPSKQQFFHNFKYGELTPLHNKNDRGDSNMREQTFHEAANMTNRIDLFNQSSRGYSMNVKDNEQLDKPMQLQHQMTSKDGFFKSSPKKLVPEDFGEALRDATDNNHAQEFHKFCFQTLLKKSTKKFRNIYQQILPVQKQATFFDSQGNQLGLISNEQKLDELPNTYRNIIKDLKIFDYQEIDSIVEAACQENFPIVSAKAWAIADPKKGEIVHGKEQNLQREVASLTKIMTAYTICRLMQELNISHPQNVYLRVSKKAAFMIGTTAFLRIDQRINIYDCLHALLLPSGNDAAIVLAIAFGKWLYFAGAKGRQQSNQTIKPTKNNEKSLTSQPSQVPIVNFEHGHDDYIQAFVQEMNRQAKKLKLEKVHFSNPHGLSEKANHASPQDVCKITAYALKYDLIREIVSKKQYDCIVISRYGEPVPYSWTNSNKLLNQYFQGVKTGITPTAGPCLCGYFQFMDFSAIGCILVSKNVDVRWRELATLMLWALDKHLKRNLQQYYLAPANYINPQTLKTKK